MNFSDGGNFNASFSAQEEHHADLTEQIEIPVVGPQGPQGEPGVSPTISVTDIAGGHRITITDATGSHSFDVMDGADGTDGSPGKDGEDGITPEISAAATTLAAGESAYAHTSGTVEHPLITFGIPRGADGSPGSNGRDGSDGKDGADGVSPTVAVTEITGGHSVAVTDKNGTQTFSVMDGADGVPGQDGSPGAPGQDGAPGADGFSPTIAVSDITGGHSVAVTDKNGTQSFNVMDGAKGDPGTTDYNNLTNKPTIPSKTSDLQNDSGFITGMYIASYGSSTFADIKAAYLANKIVYCRASSNSNPGTGNQLRMAFLAYVSGSTTSPTGFEFQYYRSVSSHSATQQGDQVFVYKVDSSGWTVTTREAYTKIAVGTGLTSSYSNGTLTISLA